jgi:hypothetical protein
MRSHLVMCSRDLLTSLGWPTATDLQSTLQTVILAQPALTAAATATTVSSTVDDSVWQQGVDVELFCDALAGAAEHMLGVFSAAESALFGAAALAKPRVLTARARSINSPDIDSNW